MASELKKYQRIKVAQERGTLADGIVFDYLDSDKSEVLVEIDGQMQIVDREDIQ